MHISKLYISTVVAFVVYSVFRPHFDHHLGTQAAYDSPGKLFVKVSGKIFAKINSAGSCLSVLLIAIFAATEFSLPSYANSAPPENSASKEYLLGKNDAAEAVQTNNDEIGILRADFGVVTNRIGPTKDWRLHPIVVVPNLPGVQYAWKLKTSRLSPVFVREEFLLPEAPSIWKVKQGEGTSQLVNGGEGIVLESFQSTDDGWLGHAWTVSPGDPSGRYQIKLWLNGKLAHTFIFNVGDAPRIGRETRTY